MASIFLPKCRSVMAFLRKWNESKGSKKGIYFALGGNNGPSLEAFWIGIYPTKNRTNKYNTYLSTYLTVIDCPLLSPKLYLMVNESVREVWSEDLEDV